MDECQNNKEMNGLVKKFVAATNGKTPSLPSPKEKDFNQNLQEFKTQMFEEISKISLALNQFIDSQKSVNNVLLGKVKCSSCGASVGDNRNGSRVSEERRKVSEEEERMTNGGDDEEKTSVVSRIGSVDSTEQSVKSVSSSVGAPEAEDETIREEDLVLSSIMNSNTAKRPPQTPLEAIFQNAFMGNGVQQKNEKKKTEMDVVDDKSAISNILEKIFSQNVDVKDIQNEKNDTMDTSDAINGFESFLNESVLSNFEPSTSEAGKTRKRKNTPNKMPKLENGGYECPMEGCNKIFKEKGSVHRHFVTHIGMRFNCDQCKASYTQKHALMLHQKIHQNPDAYQCRGCGTNYTTQNGLRLHRQRNPACQSLSETTTIEPKTEPAEEQTLQLPTTIQNEIDNLVGLSLPESLFSLATATANAPTEKSLLGNNHTNVANKPTLTL